MKQKDLFEGAKEVHELAEDYEEDYNRFDKMLNAQTIESKEEWLERLDKKGLGYLWKYPKGRKFLDNYFSTRIEGYIQENLLRKKIKYVRKGKIVYRMKPKRWSKEEVEYLKTNINKKTSELFKSHILAGRTYSSIASKKARLRTTFSQ